MRCPSCGANVPGSAAVCPSCAEPLAGATRPVPAARRRRFSLRTGMTALVVFIVLIAAAFVTWFLAGGVRTPTGAFEPEVARVVPGEADTEVFLGCIGQTGEPNVFVISVSRSQDPDPLPAGSPVPRKPSTPGGVPLTGGTPPQPPVAGTGELPVAGGSTFTRIERIETYVLDGSGGLTLSDHVGHAVEVTGVSNRIQDQRSPHLQVSSARHIADECPRP